MDKKRPIMNSCKRNTNKYKPPLARIAIRASNGRTQITNLCQKKKPS